MSAPAWLAPVVASIADRAGGSLQRGSAVCAVVTARTQDEFDVVLELTAAGATLRVWGLERRYDLPDGGEEARTAEALRAVDDWLALLGGAAGLAVYYRGSTACCWSVVGREPAGGADLRWHPAPPPSPLARWIRRWRRRVLTNRFLDGEAVRAARAGAHAAALRAPEMAGPPS